MKFDPWKAFPHPVLRIGSSDYERVEFEVTFSVERIEGTTAIELVAEFQLSDDQLMSLVKHKSASFVLLVKCQSTYFRTELKSKSQKISHVFEDGVLVGKTEVSPYIICAKAQPSFRAENWHADYDGLSFDLEEGMVLAMDHPYQFWVDLADEGPISSIFEICIGEEDDGIWKCYLHSDRIQLRLTKSDFNRFKEARSLAIESPEMASFILNGVYLPALAWLLVEADEDADEYSGRRWYASIDLRLSACGCKPLGSANCDRLVDAQKLLELPFSGLLQGFGDSE